MRKLKHAEDTKNADKALRCLDDMRILQIPANHRHYFYAINAAVRGKKLDLAHQLYDKMVQEKQTPSTSLTTFMIGACKFSKDASKAQYYMDQLLVQKDNNLNDMMFTNLINVYARTAQVEQVMATLNKMKELVLMITF